MPTSILGSICVTKEFIAEAMMSEKSFNPCGPGSTEMLDNQRRVSLVFISVCAIVWLSSNNCLAQDSVADFQNSLAARVAPTETDFLDLAHGVPVTKLLSARDKREVVVAGLAPLRAPAEIFLESFRENMTRKSNPAILEIGSFSSSPVLEDLQALTFEERDLEDLRSCVVGDCPLKLSAQMIDRLHREVDWEAPDYQLQATRLLKLILIDYVRDYVARGDAALIEYHDKQTAVRLAEEQQDLMAALGPDIAKYLNSYTNAELPGVEHALVWSKIKFGLKPVLAINQITIYKLEQENGPQILIASKQIYANHYFDSSLALTAFLSVAGANPGSYLFYENRSRVDGLGGLFGKMKRGMIENRALDSVNAILRQSQLSLEARALNRNESMTAPVVGESSWKRWKVSRGQVSILLLCITALVVLVGLRRYDWGFARAGR
jgi:hypothetical protein